VSITAEFVSIHPGYQFGRPVIHGTRIPTSSLAEHVLAGDSVQAVAEDYGISEEAVLLACWYEWHQGDRRTRRAKWAESAWWWLAGHKGAQPPAPPPVGVKK
jgi:uncharacterized protein (DUF433 family)